MKKIICTALALALLFGVFTSCSTGKKINKSKTETDSTEDYTISTYMADADSKKIGEIYDKKLDELGFEGFVYVEDNDKVLYKKSCGFADEKAKKKLTENTVFRIASITKQFTAAAVLILQERGKLSVNDKLNKYFPKCPYGDKVTLSNLLKMRSGIPDYLNYDVYSRLSAKNTAEKTRKYLLKKILNEDLRFSSGEKNEYSNSNYFLLAEIIEKVSGTSYHKFLRNNIFKKLNMTSTDFSDKISDFKGRAAKPYNYKEEDLELFKIKGFDFGCADMISTASDLKKWADALRSYRVLRLESLKIMTDAESGYGCGVNVVGECAGVYHSGSLPPYENALFISLKKPYYTCVVLSNYSYNLAGSLLMRLSKEYINSRNKS